MRADHFKAPLQDCFRFILDVGLIWPYVIIGQGYILCNPIIPQPYTPMRVNLSPSFAIPIPFPFLVITDGARFSLELITWWFFLFNVFPCNFLFHYLYRALLFLPPPLPPEAITISILHNIYPCYWLNPPFKQWYCPALHNIITSTFDSFWYTICPRSSNPFYIVSNYIKRVNTCLTYCTPFRPDSFQA